MDTITHALSGAVLARATFKHGQPQQTLSLRARTIVGFVAAAFPDSDFVLRFIDPLLYLNLHRGVTHSIIMLPVWALLLAGLFALLSRKKYTWRDMFPVCAIGIGIHICGDVITSFGTMILAPLSYMRFELPTTFIIDPIFSGILLLGLVVAIVTKSRIPARISMTTLLMYIVFQGMLHMQALDIGKKYIAATKLEDATVHALPQPLSPFNWKLVIRNGDRYRVSYLKLFSDTIPAQPQTNAGFLETIASAYYPADKLEWIKHARYGNEKHISHFARQAWQHASLKDFREFALYPALYHYSNSKTESCAWFMDLRFMLKGRQAPFRFGMCRRLNSENGEQEWRINRMHRS